MAGVFQVMAFSVGALETGESDEVFMGKLAKIATAEIISSKVCVCCQLSEPLLKISFILHSKLRRFCAFFLLRWREDESYMSLILIAEVT